MTGGLPDSALLSLKAALAHRDQGWGGQLASLWSGRPPRPPRTQLPVPHCRPWPPRSLPGHPPLLEAVPNPPPGGHPHGAACPPGAAPWASLTALASRFPAHTAPPPPLLQSCSAAAALVVLTQLQLYPACATLPVKLALKSST